MLFTFHFTSALAIPASAAVRCSPGDKCFPSPSALASFNASIGGKLHSEVPIGSPCYPSSSLYNATACSAVRSNYNDDQWRSDFFSSYEQVNWETCGAENSCLVPPNNASAICGQGSIPTYAVHATTASDVQKYVQFATKFNLRIVIKNSRSYSVHAGVSALTATEFEAGHDFQGRSSGIDGFGLWMHGVQGVSRNELFVPSGCAIAPQDSISVAAGVQWNTVYKFADDAGVLIVGGGCDKVGAAGGWLLGGGHSILSPSYGLGVDNLLEAEIVTADGKLQTVSECSNPELFWAIRGGGAGTWGVLTQVIYKVHPRVPMHVVFLTSNSSTSRANLQILSKLSAISPKLHDLSVGGVIALYPTSLIFLGVYLGGEFSDFQAAVQPVADLLPPGSVTFATYSTFLELYTATIAITPEIEGIPLALSSRLIPRHYFENDPQGLASAIRTGHAALGAEAEIEPAIIIMDSPAPKFNLGKTSVTPVWYNSLWHVVYAVAWNTSTPVAGQKAKVKAVHDAANALRAFAPDGAAYANEADVYEPNHKQSFWGAANAARLASIKKRVDPQNFFQVWQGIGWDGAQDAKYECYEELNPGGVQLNG